MEVTEVKSAAELNQTPPKFVPSTEGLPPPMDDNAVREIFAKAAAQGIDDLSTPVSAALNGQPQSAPVPVQDIPAVEVPAKFKKPDGTVDEEKLKASSAQLDVAIQEKQKTIDEVLADYKAKEKEYHLKAEEARQVKNSPPMQQMPVQQNIPPNMEAVRQQLLELQRQDPIAFAVEIAKAVVSKEIPEALAPITQSISPIVEQQKDGLMRQNIAKLAEQDPRILNPEIYKVFQAELNKPDENYFSLKNPHKAAWNEVKERLRLGEPPQRVQAQPSNLSPTLGRGVPAPVSGLPQPATQANLYQQAQTLNPYGDDAKKFEDQLREMTRLGPGGWQ